MEMPTTFENILNEMEANVANIIRDRLIAPYYANFNLSNLKMLLIGSSGVWFNERRYNTVLAMVAEEGYNHHYIPPAVWNFLENLTNTFHEGNAFEPDFTCTQLRSSTLFINICLSENHYDDENVICSIQFINKLLAELQKRGKRIAILDFRLTKHTHKNNLNDSIVQDSEAKQSGKYFTVDPAYEIINADGHLYRRFGNPGSRPYNVNDAERYKTMLEEIRNEGYPIDLMYKPMEPQTVTEAQDSPEESQPEAPGASDTEVAPNAGDI